jgi:hypothetical protein
MSASRAHLRKFGRLTASDCRQNSRRLRRARRERAGARVFYSRATESDAMPAKVLTEDETRWVAVNIARLPDPLKREE